MEEPQNNFRRSAGFCKPGWIITNLKHASKVLAGRNYVEFFATAVGADAASPWPSDGRETIPSANGQQSAAFDSEAQPQAADSWLLIVGLH